MTIAYSFTMKEQQCDKFYVISDKRYNCIFGHVY